MTLAPAIASHKDALTDAVSELRRRVAGLGAAIRDVESELRVLGGASDPGQILPVLAKSQRLLDDALRVKVAATGAENQLAIIAALKNAGATA